MLAEWFRHLTTPCPAPFKRMGYLKELIAMDARHRRCRDAWASHLRECHDLIGKATEGIGHSKVTVLGSGLLLDIPIEKLAATFEKVVLVDIVHLPQVEKRVRAFANVDAVNADVDGIAEAIWEHVGQGRAGPLPGPLPVSTAGAAPYLDSDLVILANLLTQLPLKSLELVMGKAPAYSDDEAKAFARNIIDNHLALLAVLPGRLCLLSETQRVIWGGPNGDEMIEEMDPLFGAQIPASGRKWTWDIAPRPEINRHIDLRFRMTGIADLKSAGG